MRMGLLMMVRTRIWKSNSTRTRTSIRIRIKFSMRSRISKTIRRNETPDQHNDDQDLTINMRTRGTKYSKSRIGGKQG